MNEVFLFQIRLTIIQETILLSELHHLINLHRKKSVFYLIPKLWNQVRDEIKSLESLTSFKKAIEKWRPPKCECRLCRTFLIVLDPYQNSFDIEYCMFCKSYSIFSIFVFFNFFCLIFTSFRLTLITIMLNSYYYSGTIIVYLYE